MNCVTHGEAEVYCATREMRLPTEAEWEYAATSPVKDGAADLLGGLAEWVADFMGPYREGQQVNPKGPETGAQRVIRGGSLRGSRAPADKADVMTKLAPKAREGAAPAQRADNLGFRCAKPIR
jgi:formylglycine-generating enzyme required for sulfatase activity